MKKLLMTIAVVLLMAVPAMADDPVDEEVDVNLKIESWMTVAPFADVEISLVYPNLSGSIQVVGDVYSNDFAKLTATVKVTKVGSVGSWSVNQPPTWNYVTGDPAKAWLFTHVNVTVLPSDGPQDELGAVVTFTITPGW